MQQNNIRSMMKMDSRNKSNKSQKKRKLIDKAPKGRKQKVRVTSRDKKNSQSGENNRKKYVMQVNI